MSQAAPTSLKPSELPYDFGELVAALVECAKYPDAAVAVHDLKLAGRLLQLGLAEASVKGLRGTPQLAAILAEHGTSIVARLMCTEVPAPANVQEPSEPTVPVESAAQPSTAPQPVSLSQVLTRPETFDVTDNSHTVPDEHVAQPSSEAVLSEQAVAVSTALDDSASERPTEVATGAPVEEPLVVAETSPVLLDERMVEALAKARALRDSITALSRELQTVLQPIAGELVATGTLAQLQQALELFPPSLQRNAVIQRAAELSGQTERMASA